MSTETAGLTLKSTGFTVVGVIETGNPNEYPLAATAKAL
jgi:hypothetical protein